jgi:predicted phosphodiesterase
MRARFIQGMSHMKLVDLGELDAPVLLFGGAYSNLQATRAVLDVARTEGIAASHVICTGDVVAYCADAAQTVALIREHGCSVVAGNCEKQLAAYQDDCGCGFEMGTTCDLLSAGWYAHANRTVGAEDRAWMAGLPDMIQFTHLGQTHAVIHGGMSDVSRFLWPVSSDAEFWEEINLIQQIVPQTSCVISGHSGLAFQRELDGVTWVNAGAVGMPPHDGAPHTRYAILSDGVLSFHRLEYDAHAAALAMEQAGLVQGYHHALTRGYWPSEEVLPPVLRVSSRASG